MVRGSGIDERSMRCRASISHAWLRANHRKPRRREATRRRGSLLQLDRLDFSSVQVSSPGVEPGPRPSQSRVRIRHTPRTCCWQCLADESNVVLELRRLPCASATLARQRYVSIPTWIRTRTRTFGGSDAILYTIGIQTLSSPDDRADRTASVARPWSTGVPTSSD